LENFLDFFLETRNTNICKSLRFTLPLNDHEETALQSFQRCLETFYWALHYSKFSTI
jgi:hypothetical protein